MEPKKLKIILTDDHEIVLDGLVALLATEPEFKIVGKARDGRQLLDILKTKSVDLIIMDIDMPNMDGIQASKQVKKLYPKTKILVLTMYSTSDFVKSLVRTGVDGYILKFSPKSRLLKAIRSVAQNQFFYTPEITDELIQSLRKDDEKKEKAVLSKREKQIIRLVVQEFTTKEIANKVNLSFHTVEKHRKNILTKLGLRNTAGIVRYAFENGLIKDELEDT